MFKKGDTLIEVMLAVGIFSMVAVAVVAVMSGGTSSAQTALETTLAREEIDAQAEALRFIQSSYIAEKDDKDSEFAKLWQLVTGTSSEGNKVNVVTSEGDIANIAQYAPTDCTKLYESEGEAKKYGFVINTRALGDSPSQAVISVKNQSDLFAQASTYPRLIYNNDNGALITSGDNTLQSTLQKAEGIYIIAVKDPNSTSIANKGKTSAYYDFYIRTCWYGTGDNTPSAISTVMRLYDPSIVKD